MAISNLLSDEEISALLHSRQSPASWKGASDHERIVEPLNFMSTGKQGVVFSAGFSASNERFSLVVTAALSKWLQKKVRLDMLEPRIISFGDYLNTLDHPALLGLVSLKSSPHKLIVAVKPQLLYQMVNILFGGSAARDSGHYSEFGKVDLAINQRAVELILESLGQAWQENYQIEPQQIEMVSRLKTITTPAAKKSMLLMSYLLTINEIKTEFQLLFDAELIENFDINSRAEDLAKSENKEEQAWKDKLHDSIYDVTLPAVAAFPPIELKLAELSRLKEGDVIFLENHQLVDVSVAGLNIFRAYCGVSAGTRVIHITDSDSR